MKPTFLARALIPAFLLGLAPCSTLANDSSAAIGIGGLVLEQNDDISLDFEELRISIDRIQVRYVFTSHSDRDVSTLVAFPLPAMPGEMEEDLGDRASPNWNELDFVTRIDGVEVPLDRHDSATIDGRAVNDRLAELGWPVFWASDWDFIDSLSDLPQTERDAYVAEGLLRPDSGKPAWSAQASITREQVFPAGQSVAVEHSYNPLAGASVGGSLEQSSRSDSLPYYADAYCVDDGFLSDFDQFWESHAQRLGTEYAPYAEHFVDYVLSSGANWHGPIRDFRLVIEKNNPETLISLCMEGDVDTSPTTVEYRLTDFEPDRDLKVLFIEWARLP